MIFREAERIDIASIVEMLADDEFGKQREEYKNPLSSKYYKAFKNIVNDDNQELIVAENDKNEIVGTLQLSFIQYLTYKGGIRAQIEAVRIRKDQRGKGFGEILFKWAINRAKERGAHMIQLTTDKKRPDALKFYKKLGFSDTHEGMKMHFKF